MLSLKSTTKTLRASLFYSTLVAFTLSSNALSATTEDFFYQKGYENGYSKGYEAGVIAAFNEAKSVLNQYGNELKAYEVGKYLIQSNNLTYPQVFQQINDKGEISLRVLPSKLEKQLNVEELFAKFSTLPTIPRAVEEDLELSLESKNSVFLPTRDANYNNLPQNVDTSVKTTTLQVDKTSQNLEILKKANVVFSDENDNYNVLFFTHDEKNDFCKSYKICR